MGDQYSYYEEIVNKKESLKKIVKWVSFEILICSKAKLKTAAAATSLY